MTRLGLLKRNLIYYWRTNAAVVLGVATSVSVLAGALLVGDSVRASLRSLVLNRLGNADYVITSAGFFREQLADDLQGNPDFAAKFSAASPLIVLEGLIDHDESGRRASGVQVYGVDSRFWRFHGIGAVLEPSDRQVLLSPGLARELGADDGDSVLLTVERPSSIPRESLHGRKEDVARTTRLSIRSVLPATALGEFSIKPRQGAVRAVFVPLAGLQRDLNRPRGANTILVKETQSGSAAEPTNASEALRSALKKTTRFEDVGVKLRALESQQCLQLESETGLINDSLLEAAKSTASQLNMSNSGILSYLANTIRSRGREIPYSVVTALEEEDFKRLVPPAGLANRSAGEGEPSGLAPLVLNDWAAADLGARVGDELALDYFVWKDEGQLETESSRFRLAGVVALDGPAADPDLVPAYPGITESDSMSDWDPPFPIELSRVRPRDEEYWDRYRATPKAFTTLETGMKLWQSRYGSLTSVRLSGRTGRDLNSSLDDYAKELRARINPADLGVLVLAARAEGLEASGGATDFGEYFVYFSFFLVVSALLLTGLFFKLGIEQRLREIGLLRAIGFSPALVRNLFLTEGVLLAMFGAAAGLVGAVAYSALMMLGLRTWWVDAVGTTLLTLYVSPVSLVFGAAAGLAAAVLFITVTLRSVAGASVRSLLVGSLVESRVLVGPAGRSRSTNLRSAAVLLGLACAGLLLGAWAGWIGQVVGFFGAGSALLIAIFCWLGSWLGHGRKRVIKGTGWWPVSRLGFRGSAYRPSRSLLCIALIASATFVIVAVDSFRRDAAEIGGEKSGSGGYELIAESVLPVIPNPNTAPGRESLNLYPREGMSFDDVWFERFRLRPGDDASCLNLYKPRNPRILAPTPDFISRGRFAFRDHLGTSIEEKENPWLLLDRELAEGVVPVIADANSLSYVLHLGLGDEFTLERGDGEAIRFQVVASLSDSILQSELLISETNFIELFPESEGYRFFLIDAPAEKTAEVSAALEDQLSDLGFDAQAASERLAAFHRVENTYLSTFQTLGGLGLLLGTLGLGTILLRNVLERRRELALMRAMGYASRHFVLMVISENLLLLVAGLVTGTVCAVVAVMPALLDRGGGLPVASVGVLLLIVLLTGMAASIGATLAALKSPLLAALKAE